VRDNRGREQVKSVLIVVADPVTVFAGTNTVCFANGSGPQAFVGCPPGATQVTAQNVEALQPHIGTNRRLLLRRGDKFKSASSVFIRATGPGLIGAFGSGSPPAIATSAEYVFQMEGPRSGLADWRFTDLHVEGGSNSQTLAVGSTAFNVLLLRMSLFKGRAGLNTGIHSIPEGHDIVDGHFVHECDFKALDGYALYTAARRFAFVGNTLTDTVHRSRGSLMRLHWLDRAVISDNQLGPGNIDGGDVLYIPGPPFTGGERSIGNGQYTSRVLISGNVFQSGGGLAKVGPQNVSSDERFRDIIVERNLFLPTPPAWGGLTFDGDVQQATVRDNLFFIQARTGGECIVLRKGGSRGASPSDVSVSHNTCIGAKGIDLLKFQSDSTGVVANNNLVVGEDQQLVSGNGTLAASAGNQMGDAAWAQLSSNSPKQWSEFLPKLKSPAVAAGDNAYTGTLDYRGIPRDERPDVGALEHSRGERVPSTSKSTKAP
jgi:hypothetical protein